MSTAVAISPVSRGIFWVSKGVTPESEEVHRLEAKYVRDRQTPAWFAWRDSVFEQVANILQECSSEGWDGYDAAPVSHDSAHKAVQFLNDLPDWIQPPTAVPEPDGDIAFEWRTEDGQLFSLSVSERTIVFAGIFGGSSKLHGEEPFLETTPPSILQILSEHFPAH